MRKPKEAFKMHDYVFDIYVARRGEWVGTVEVSARNLRDAIKAAKERHSPGGNPRWIKAVPALRDGNELR